MATVATTTSKANQANEGPVKVLAERNPNVPVDRGMSLKKSMALDSAESSESFDSSDEEM